MTAAPEWLIIKAPYLSLAAIRVICAVVKEGRQICNTGGYPVIHLQASLTALEAQCNLTRRSLLRGITEALAHGLLVQTRPMHTNAATGYSVPIFMPVADVGGAGGIQNIPPLKRGIKSIPPHVSGGRESIPPTDSGGILSIPPLVPPLTTPLISPDDVVVAADILQQQHTRVNKGVQGEKKGSIQSIPPELRQQLIDLGENFPEQLSENYKLVQIRRALAITRSEIKTNRIANPAGFLRTLLQKAARQGTELPDRESKYAHLIHK